MVVRWFSAAFGHLVFPSAFVFLLLSSSVALSVSYCPLVFKWALAPCSVFCATKRGRNEIYNRGHCRQEKYVRNRITKNTHKDVWGARTLQYDMDMYIICFIWWANVLYIFGRSVESIIICHNRRLNSFFFFSHALADTEEQTEIYHQRSDWFIMFIFGLGCRTCSQRWHVWYLCRADLPSDDRKRLGMIHKSVVAFRSHHITSYYVLLCIIHEHILHADYTQSSSVLL